jgi:RluA family pseudouridine synthase
MIKQTIVTIYEDQYLLVIDKPSGLLAVPALGAKGRDATSLLSEMLSLRRPGAKAYPCHRIDQETSGIVVFAKDENTQQLIMDQFRDRNVRKTYVAFVHGRLAKKKGTLTSHIEGGWPYHQREKKKLAITKYEVLASARGFSVVKMEPVTGRTNQIRIQFGNVGNPLVGERRFTVAKDWPIRFKRVALHAAEIEFTHPVSRKPFLFVSPLARDMQDFLKQHRIALPEYC